VYYSSPPLNDVQAGSAARFATVIRDSLPAASLLTSGYSGFNGLNGRPGLAALNFA
jgi:N-acetylmuramoyl-L-alanine amidase